MKRIFFLFVATLLLIPVFPVDAEAQEGFTDTEIIKEIERIANSYDLYEPLKEKDAKFIEKYADMPTQSDAVGINGYNSISFDETKYNTSGTVGVWITGMCWADIGIINNSFGGNFNTYVILGGSRVDKIVNTVRHTAFGLIGSGGIGKVYDGSITNTCYSSVCTTNSSKSYVASVAYSYTWVSATVYYDNGSILTVGSQ